MKENGATYFFKRIDTTLRGNIGAEVEAMLEMMDEDTIGIMVPAMPQSKRIIVGGLTGSIQTAADIVERIVKEASVRDLIEN